MHNDPVRSLSQLRRLRSGVKGLLGRPLAALVIWRLRRTDASLGIAVVYHRIGTETGDPQTEFVPAMGADLFTRQVAYLDRRFRLVAPEALPAAVAERPLGARLPAAITFDDDLASHVTHALPVLTRSGVRAGFFLCGASLDEAQCFWWERLDRAAELGVGDEVLAGAGAPSASGGRRTDVDALRRWFEQLPALRREGLSGELRDVAGGDPPDAGVRSDDVRAMVCAGFEVGFHTLHHDALPELSDAQLARALVDGRERMEDLCGPIASFAYPHGRHDRRVVEAVRDSGFRIAFTTTGTAVRGDDDPLMLSRIEASFDSVGALAYSLGRALWRARGRVREP
jgi:peptidoglycan/xylan/chitin deacetylase (PgdA/CDA1 family)